jgi:CO/xanthine dehydrogenase FAD-binding subunit
VEIAAGVPVAHILSTGKYILPSVLLQALANLGTPLVRNIATLGGNICVRERRLDSFPVLQLLNVLLELRRSGGLRWIPISKLVDERGDLQFKPGEVLTRIRIPFDSWDIQEYTKIERNSFVDGKSLSYCCVMRTQRSLIQDFKFAYGYLGSHIIRDRNLEAELTGKNLPISKKERTIILDLLSETLEQYTGQLTEFQKSRALHIMHRFLSRLSGM